jgi:ribonuclease HI
MIVIMCDGTSKGNPGQATLGVVVWERMNNPKVVKPTVFWSKSLGIKTNMEAEWEALLSAMNWVFTHAPRNEEVYIFSDAQVVVKQATGVYKVKHENIKPLYKKFIELCGTPKERERIHIQWVPRQLVYLADKAAQQKGNSK